MQIIWTRTRSWNGICVGTCIISNFNLFFKTSTLFNINSNTSRSVTRNNNRSWSGWTCIIRSRKIKFCITCCTTIRFNANSTRVGRSGSTLPCRRNNNIIIVWIIIQVNRFFINRYTYGLVLPGCVTVTTLLP